MSTNDRTRAAPRLPEGHTAPLLAADQFMGGFCIYMTVVAAVAWSRGQTTWHTPAAIFGYVLINFLWSRLVTSRAASPRRGELLRLAVMTVANPVVYFATDGPLALWWPGFLINALGQSIVLGLITQRAFWGTMLAVYYVALYGLCTVLGARTPDWYEFALNAGIIAMVSLLWAKIMSLLGAALRNEHLRSLELARVSDALFGEMEIALQIQTQLLPREPRLDGLTIHGRMLPATEVGGDYYDVIPTSQGRTFLAIGDVSGHGVASGLAMMMARASLLGAVEASPAGDLGHIYRVLNRCLHDNLVRMDAPMYMTFGLLEHRGAGSFCAVGRHLPLFVHRRGSNTVEELQLEGTWLGMIASLDERDVPEIQFALEPGDTLVLYTDGVVEHANAREMFGHDRLRAVILEHVARGPVEMVDTIVHELERFSSVRADDMTMLVIAYTGPVTSGPASTSATA